VSVGEPVFGGQVRVAHRGVVLEAREQHAPTYDR
jgi:hypothetical protein